MSDLRFENPATTDAFAELLKSDAPLPWAFDSENAGIILDANGVHVVTVDQWRDRDDAVVLRLASWIVLAVNTCGGFQAVRG